MEKKLADRLANFGSSGFLKVGYRSTSVAAPPKSRDGATSRKVSRSSQTPKKAAS